MRPWGQRGARGHHQKRPPQQDWGDVRKYRRPRQMPLPGIWMKTFPALEVLLKHPGHQKPKFHRRWKNRVPARQHPTLVPRSQFVQPPVQPPPSPRPRLRWRKGSPCRKRRYRLKRGQTSPPQALCQTLGCPTLLSEMDHRVVLGSPERQRDVFACASGAGLACVAHRCRLRRRTTAHLRADRRRVSCCLPIHPRRPSQDTDPPVHRRTFPTAQLRAHRAQPQGGCQWFEHRRAPTSGDTPG